MKIVANPITWSESKNGDHEGEHGLYITVKIDDAGDPHKETFLAAWGEGDSEEFDTLKEAKAWCQNQIDDYFTQYGRVESDLFDMPN